MKKLALFFSLFFISPSQIYSQENFWEPISGPLGGYVKSVLSNSSLEIFVATSVGIYKSSNFGADWINIRQGNYSRFVITPQNNLIIANSRQVYLSINSGNVWQQIYLSSEDITSIGTDLDGDIFVATNKLGINFSFTKIFKSSDLGLNWNTIYSGSEGLTSFEFDKNNVYVGYLNGILKSTNRGQSWTNINISGSSSCFDIEIDALDNIYFAGGHGVFRSTDNGITWQYIGFNNLLPLSLETDSSEYIYVGTQNGVYFSTNQGQSWFESSSRIQNQIIFSIEKTVNGMLLCGTGGAGVYSSIDNATSWAQIGVPEINVLSLFNNSQNVLYAGTYSAGVFKSIDNGNNWIGSGLAGMKINAMAINSNGLMYAGGEPMTIANNKHLFVSTDSGINWSPLNHPYVRINKIVVNSQNFIYTATAGGGVYRSTNNGLTWEQKNSGLTGSHIKSIALNSNYEIFAGTDYYGICKSTNNGNIWQQIGLPDYSINDIEINSVGEIYVSTYKHYQTFEIYKSTDDGVTWVKFNSGIPNVPVSTLTKNDNDDIFAGTGSDGVYILFRDSLYWSAINSGLSNLTVNALITNNEGFIFAGTNGSGIFRSNRTTTIVNEYNETTLSSFTLFQNYPNPFNPSTKISWQSPVSGWQTLKVYDVLGNEVATLVNEYRTAGNYEVEFNPASSIKHPASGIYFYRLQAGDPSTGSGQSFVETKKMILLK